MPEPILLALALLAAGAGVLWSIRRAPAADSAADDEPRSAEMRHRLALESLRDVEADRRARSLDDPAYAVALADAEARAAETRAALDRTPSAEPMPAARGSTVSREVAWLDMDEARLG